MKWMGAIGKVPGIILSIAGAASVVFGVWLYLFHNPLKTNTFTANTVTPLSSTDIDSVVKGGVGGLAFDTDGSKFDYEKPPSRPGYLVHYQWGFTGRGSGEIDYAIEDSATSPPRILTKSTQVVVELDPFGYSETFDTDFFVATGKLDPTAAPCLIITASTSTDQSAVNVNSQTLKLAPGCDISDTVALR
jgi:hypothetical protein